jgi:hypothetical protein
LKLEYNFFYKIFYLKQVWERGSFSEERLLWNSILKDKDEVSKGRDPLPLKF